METTYWKRARVHVVLIPGPILEKDSPQDDSLRSEIDAAARAWATSKSLTLASEISYPAVQVLSTVGATGFDVTVIKYLLKIQIIDTDLGKLDDATISSIESYLTDNVPDILKATYGPRVIPRASVDIANAALDENLITTSNVKVLKSKGFTTPALVCNVANTSARMKVTDLPAGNIAQINCKTSIPDLANDLGLVKQPRDWSLIAAMIMNFKCPAALSTYPDDLAFEWGVDGIMWYSLVFNASGAKLYFNLDHGEYQLFDYLIAGPGSTEGPTSIGDSWLFKTSILGAGIDAATPHSAHRKKYFSSLGAYRHASQVRDGTEYNGGYLNLMNDSEALQQFNNFWGRGAKYFPGYYDFVYQGFEDKMNLHKFMRFRNYAASEATGTFEIELTDLRTLGYLGEFWGEGGLNTIQTAKTTA